MSSSSKYIQYTAQVYVIYSHVISSPHSTLLYNYKKSTVTSAIYNLLFYTNLCVCVCVCVCVCFYKI